MARKHDLMDDLIDIQKGLGDLRAPMGDVTSAFLGEKPERPVWNPADYKDRPRANTMLCTRCVSERSGCTRCLDVCPVDALSIEDGGIDISDTCRKCGLCVAACPTEALISRRIMPKDLYAAVGKAAVAHTTAYVTCTRALRRVPRENEVVVACVGDVAPETWFAIMEDFPKVSVYLPLGICDKCRTLTGEEALGESIATAEEWAGRGMGLEVEKSALTCRKRREYERKEFMESVKRSTGLAASAINPAIGAVTSVAARLRARTEKFEKLEQALDAACGVSEPGERRQLTERRQLLMGALRTHPSAATRVKRVEPSCDVERCTMCGACAEACPLNACELEGGSRFHVESAYCAGCGLCADVCAPKALTMREADGQVLVVPDPEAERKAEEAAVAHRKAAEAKAKVKRNLDIALDAVEKLADE